MADLDFSLEDVLGTIAEVLPSEVEISDDEIVVALTEGNESATFRMPPGDLEKILEQLRRLRVSGETALFDSTCLEMFVREAAPYGPSLFMRRRGGLLIDDPASGLSYRLDRATDAYLVFLLMTLKRLGSLGAIWRRRPLYLRRRRVGQEDMFEEESPRWDTPLDALRLTAGRMITLRIDSQQPKSVEELQSLSDGFLFHFAFNTDMALVPVASLEEVARRVRIRRMRRTRLEELDPPRREYRSGLVKHYQLGVATESVPLEYLSYYQVAENYFEDVFNDDMLGRVEALITSPNFSYQRRRDLDRLVRIVKKRLRIRGEEMVFSEEEALRLTLMKYVRLPQLVDELRQIDPELIDRYRMTEVSFSDAPSVDLEAEDSKLAVRQLSRRLYQTRNAVVHSKEGGRPRYVPFTHDRELSQEIPLIRLVAEQILINSSRVLP